MDYKNVLDILDSSFSYRDYKNTYYDFIINGAIRTSQLTKDERIEYHKRKKEIKARLYKQFENEYPDRLIQIFLEISYLPDTTQEDLEKLYDKFDKATEPLLKQHNFNERIKKLR